MCELRNILKEHYRKISSITGNVLLDDIYRNMLPVYEKNENHVDETEKKGILDRAKGLPLDIDSSWTTFYQDFNELIIRLDLENKGFNVSKIREGCDKSPDYRIHYEDCDIYGELKSLDFASGQYNHQKTQKDFLDANVKLEEQRKRGQRVCISETVVSPWGENTPDDAITIIKKLQEKILQNFKADQFKLGNTVFFISLNMLLLKSPIQKTIYPVFEDEISLVSGILWNLAFGKEGDNIFDYVRFEGRENLIGTLNTEGLLRQGEQKDLDLIKALIFCENKEGIIEYYSLYRSKDEGLPTTHFAKDISKKVNDDLNSHFWGRV